MREDRIYQIRRALLTAFKDCHPAPCGVDDVLCHPGCGLLHIDKPEALEELRCLELKGYLRAVEGTNGAYHAITGKGLDQINQEVDRDLYIWGKYGLR